MRRQEASCFDAKDALPTEETQSLPTLMMTVRLRYCVSQGLQLTNTTIHSDRQNKQHTFGEFEMHNTLLSRTDGTEEWATQLTGGHNTQRERETERKKGEETTDGILFPTLT